MVLSPGAPRPQAPKKKHLDMVPLSGRSEGTYDDGKDLGTNAFARPTPQQPMGPSGPVAQPMGPPPMMGIQGPVAGPVAGGPMPGGPMPGAMPPGAMGAGVMAGQFAPEERATSHRVFVILIALVLMVCGAVMVTAMLFAFAVIQSNQPEPLEPLENPVVMAPPQGRAGGGLDTGGPKAEEPAARPKPTSRPRPRPTQPRPSPSPSAGGGTPAPPPQPPAPPVGAAGSVTVTLPASQKASSFEVSCASANFRERAMFNGSNKATMPNVPGAPCIMRLKGLGPPKKFSFQGAHNFTCSGVGSDIICR